MFFLLSILFLPGHNFSGCDDFTVGSCSPDPNQTILTLNLPNTGEQWKLCEDQCDVQEDCAYWSLSCPDSSVPCLCSLLKYSYLHSCKVVGGSLDTDIEVII